MNGHKYPSNNEALNVSYETVRKIASQLDRKEITKRRYGRRDAERKHTPRGAGVITTRPLERVEIDHFLCDAYVLVWTGSGYARLRPWITVAIDHYSGAILGYHISFAAPSSTSVLAVLRKAIMPK